MASDCPRGVIKTMKECGTCTMCCKTLGVVELDKPANRWCVHCTPGKGCGIYADRPPTCHNFRCAWLDMADLPDDLKPDKIHAVVWAPPDGTDGNADIIVHEDPGYYALGQSRERISKLMDIFHRQHFTVCFINGERRKMFRPSPSDHAVWVSDL